MVTVFCGGSTGTITTPPPDESEPAFTQYDATSLPAGAVYDTVAGLLGVSIFGPNPSALSGHTSLVEAVAPPPPTSDRPPKMETAARTPMGMSRFTATPFW
jgi:hypothetical protein